MKLRIVFSYSIVGLVLAFASCYDANSPHLTPCPDGGNGYTDPAGCFGHAPLDGGPDAR